MSKNSVILGISFGHGDSSAALIVDGTLVAAVEEERFTRVKHDASFPTRSITYCLRHAGVTADQVKTIAVARRPYNAFIKRLALIALHPKMLSLKRSSFSWQNESHHLGLERAAVICVEHHLAHLASCRYLASQERLALFSFDGMGDFVSAALGIAEGDDFKILHRVHFPHSLGYFYTAMTQYLGFPHFGDEFKVMGLSSFGNPKSLSQMQQLIWPTKDCGFELNLRAFPILAGKTLFALKNNQPVVQPIYDEAVLKNLLGVSRRPEGTPIEQVHCDLAKSVQMQFEEIANHLLCRLHKRVKTNALGIAGGCAHNSVWVGKIPSHTPFKEIFVAPASSDAGIAVGAAIRAYGRAVKPEGGHWALLGPSEIQPLSTPGVSYSTDAELIRWMVEELSVGKIIGLFRGRMEFGPRALGSRSILCDPRFPQMKEKLNARVKHRESFRPFAASVLREFQNQWFKDDFYSPSMEAVFEVREYVRHQIPSVVHVDQTCRIQSVDRATQPFYWDLIHAFYKKTGVPMLLNTSFNDCEPIVCSEKDAWECFQHTEMDALVIGRSVYLQRTEPRVREAVRT